MARGQDTKLPAPYLRAVRFADSEERLPQGFPFNLPWLTPDFELEFDQPVTILMGENGAGKSTLLEALASLAGFPVSGGGAWASARPKDEGAEALALRLRASWMPRMKKGWFLKAMNFSETSGQTASDYLSMSHGEGFSEMIADRLSGQGVFMLDEPEAALSPSRQLELLRFLSEFQQEADGQVIMATHSPILMAVPGATLLQITHRDLREVSLRETEHFRLMSAFTDDPEGFVQATLDGDADNLYLGAGNGLKLLRSCVIFLDMPSLTVSSQFGPLTLSEEDGAIVAVGWDGHGTDDTTLLREAAAQMRAYDAGELRAFDLPLRVAGSDFQRAVCDQMSAIPFGETVTYGDISKALGVPAQAVGSACGGNPIPIIIPCHRVMGAKGLTGFSGKGGVETKVALLRHEGAGGFLI